MISLIIVIFILFILAVVDSIFTIALWVIHKINKEETSDFENRL